MTGTHRINRKGLRTAWAVVFFGVVGTNVAPGAEVPSGRTTEFRSQIRPLLETYCFDCHGDGSSKGNVSFDTATSDQELFSNHELWLKVLKNLRAGLMPPPQKQQPSGEQKARIGQWIKSDVFALDTQNPDPGRITVRRLNRAEYRNTIRDLMGVEFDVEREFPPDDAGHGFDNIGDVLTLPPMLLEKYLAAARTIVSKAVPATAGVPAETTVAGRDFAGEIGVNSRTNRSPMTPGALVLSYYERARVTNTHEIKNGGRYKLLLDFTANERFVDNQFDYNKCRLVFKADGQELHRHDYTREGGKAFHFEFEKTWKTGAHDLVVEVEPLTPDKEQVRSLTLRLDSVTVRGPLEEKYWVRPKNYDRFFGASPLPRSASGRRKHARQILESFVGKAFRRPADARTVERLIALAEATWTQKGKTFEAGVGQAMVAVLASPRFLFREEGLEPVAGSPHPFVDEYALASRLSYFLWSSMPDDELLRLASERKLRANLGDQTRRMLAEPKSDALVRNFVGQWLQTRDIDSVQIDARQVLAREAPADPESDRRRSRFRELREKPEEKRTAEEKKEMEELRGTFFRRFGRGPRLELTGDLRRAMRRETEMTVGHVLREDRSLVELLDSNYTFLNERLARHYGLTNLNVTGDEMRLVQLPDGNARGGILGQGSVLAVTSNPTRTSPVKRGLFILDNILGSPPAPPPPDIPPLEDAVKGLRDRTPTLRETLALHREAPLCSSCHNRMDPLGLALENFNAMGMWRDQERSQQIDSSGKLLSGESFTNVVQLKKILATHHTTEFYRTVTEKLLTYALGRGLEYYDVATVDAIVDRLESSNGRPSVLLSGIIQSAPFLKTRTVRPAGHAVPPAGTRAQLTIEP
ncbi:MAG TPA: DUF1592 domain-containing protein [Verrucomicrobiae bacterium]|nr:DUF1592 domain-containing protein [Verrucomicrobiae bacterium]